MKNKINGTMDRTLFLSIFFRPSSSKKVANHSLTRANKKRHMENLMSYYMAISMPKTGYVEKQNYFSLILYKMRGYKTDSANRNMSLLVDK